MIKPGLLSWFFQNILLTKINKIMNLNKQESEEVIRNLDKMENITIGHLNRIRREIFFTLRDDKGIETGYSIFLYLSNRKRMMCVYKYEKGTESFKRSYEEDVDLRSSIKEVLALIKGRELR